MQKIEIMFFFKPPKLGTNIALQSYKHFPIVLYQNFLIFFFTKIHPIYHRFDKIYKRGQKNCVIENGTWLHRKFLCLKTYKICKYKKRILIILIHNEQPIEIYNIHFQPFIPERWAQTILDRNFFLVKNAPKSRQVEYS